MSVILAPVNVGEVGAENTVDIVGDVFGWYRMPNNYTYYVNNQTGRGPYPNNSQRLTEDAVQAANADVNFANYDPDNDGYVNLLFIIHAGPGAEVTGLTY